MLKIQWQTTHGPKGPTQGGTCHFHPLFFFFFDQNKSKGQIEISGLIFSTSLCEHCFHSNIIRQRPVSSRTIISNQERGKPREEKSQLRHRAVKWSSTKELQQAWELPGIACQICEACKWRKWTSTIAGSVVWSPMALMSTPYLSRSSNFIAYFLLRAFSHICKQEMIVILLGLRITGERENCRRKHL